jgi:hypothetical protein
MTGVTSVVVAQHDHNTHQDSMATTNNNPLATNEYTQKQLSQLLSAYLNIKNALVTGDGGSAATNANDFLRIANTIDFKVISEGNIQVLAKDAGKISGTKDLKKQRQYFAALSTNVIAVARVIKLSSQPIYLQYCPMKDASWISTEKAIRNPYYGNTMLTCGEVKETL